MQGTSYPRMEIFLDRIRHNVAVVCGRARAHGVEIVGVTKGLCGEPLVARAMLEGGVSALGDSRLSNLARLRREGINAPLMLIRIPMMSEARWVPRVADISLQSEPAVARVVGEEAAQCGRRHRVILMVDTGDLREGVWPERVLHVARQMHAMPGLELWGMGTNTACYGGVLPTPENTGLLVRLAQEVRDSLGVPLPVVSGGNTATYFLLEQETLPAGITQLRMGEGLLLGVNTTVGAPIRGARQDTIRLLAEVIEVARKPSVPIGPRGRDGFGEVPQFEDRGWHRRAVVALGRQDVDVRGVTPLLPGAKVLGGSSDHLLLDVEDCPKPPAPGDVVAFGLNYSAMLRAATSAYVQKVYKGK